jgi:hypothetical protein
MKLSKEKENVKGKLKKLKNKILKNVVSKK